MKLKKVIIIAMAMCISVSAMAQFKFGVKTGLNVSNLSEIKVTDDGLSRTNTYDMLTGFHLGGYVNYSINSLIGVQTELVFSAQGGKLANSNWNNRKNYLNIPLLIDIKPIENRPFSILAGPQFGFKAATFTSGQEEVGNTGIPNFDFDFALVLGVQYTFIEHLTVGLRFNAGLIPSENYEYTNHTGYYKAKGGRNNVLQLSAGWTF